MRIAVAMSGGVDSSVAALLLKEQGHDVFGVSMQLYDGPGSMGVAASRRCCGVRDIADARRVAGELDIPFYVANFRDVFRRAVMDPFVASYASGLTPIPCVACNSGPKFGVLLPRVLAMGAEALATGHYARIAHDGSAYRLRRALDGARDQSYFLYQLGQEELARVLFPLGDLPKEAVRERARVAGLPVCDKPDSQEICFVPDGDHAGFVAARRDVPAGDIRDRQGNLLGQHEGIHRFTVGQRRGLGSHGPDRRYVVAMEPESATVVVGREPDLYSREALVEAVSWVAGTPGTPLRGEVRIRSRHEQAGATIAPDGDRARVTFDTPQRAVAPGQAAVFYSGDEVLGGGTLARQPAFTAAR